MASLQLRLRPKPTLRHLRLFSSNTDPPPTPQNDTAPESELESKFNDLKGRLKQTQQPPQRPPNSSTSLEEIRKNLSEYRRRTTVPPPSSYGGAKSTQRPPQRPISFQELYKRNVGNNEGSDVGGGGGSGSGSVQKSGKLSYDSIRESLRKVRANAPKGNEGTGPQPFSFSAFRNSLKSTPEGNAAGLSRVIGGTTSTLPLSVFGREMRDKEEEEDGEKDPAMKNKFVRTYNFEELGQKLRKLRPGGVWKQKEGWFSLGELNERLVKLREMEEKEAGSKMSNMHADLRASLEKLKSDDKAKKAASGE